MINKLRTTRWWINHHLYWKFLLGLAVLLALTWPFAWGLIGLDQWTGESEFNSARELLVPSQSLILFIGILTFLTFRINKNPLVKQEHRDLLIRMGWHADKPLPFGTCFFTFTDVIAISGLFALLYARIDIQNNQTITDAYTHLFGTAPDIILWLSLLSCIIAMTFFQWMTAILAARRRVVHILLLLTLPVLIVYPHFLPSLSLMAFVLIHLTSRWVIQNNLKHFVWEKPYYDVNPVKRLRDEAAKSKLILAHFKRLAPRMTRKPTSLGIKLLVALLVCWWCDGLIGILEYMYKAAATYSAEDNFSANFLPAARDPLVAENMLWTISFHITVVPVFILNVALASWYMARFLVTGPIHIYARPFNFHWHIRKFDAILLTPILSSGLCLTLFWLANLQLISPRCFLYLSILGTLLIQWAVAPSAQSWFFTWNHSLFIGKQPDPRKQLNTQTIEIKIDAT